MVAWPEIDLAKKEKRYELILSGSSISERIKENGIDKGLFELSGLNFLRISETILQQVPAEIACLHNLTSLVLYSNNITQISTEIEHLTKLKVLDLSRNKIEVVPEQIKQLESLSTLNISSNQITTLPDLRHNTKLAVLDISCNNIEDITGLCVKELSLLAEIYAKGNSITVIPNAINELVSLKIFDVNDNSIKSVPKSLAECAKIKEINLKGNPLTDKRLNKLVDQCRTKQIVDYVREHGSGDVPDSGQKGKKGKNKGKAKHDSVNLDSELANQCNKLFITKQENVAVVHITEYVKDVRPHLVTCIVRRLSFTDDTFKKFIQLQTRLHDSVCDKRNAATIATHDLDLCKFPITYTALSPARLKITPLGRNKEFTGLELFTLLQSEADALRKEKKRNVYSGVHKYLYLIEGKPVYPCMLDDENKRVISFPPITNSDATKISVTTKNMLVEVTSSTSQGVAKKVLDTLLLETVGLGISDDSADGQPKNLYVEQVRIEDPTGNLKLTYPSRTDLSEKDNIIVLRD